MAAKAMCPNDNTPVLPVNICSPSTTTRLMRSTVATLLAAKLGGSSVDLDECVERDSGKSPRDLFMEGPEHFRRQEAESLQLLLNLHQMVPGNAPLVLATGGGIVDNPPAWELLQNRCILILLDIDANTAFTRILESSKTRGLPSFLNTEDPRETHRALHDNRMARYRAAADLRIETAAMSPQDCARNIYNELIDANMLDP